MLDILGIGRYRYSFLRNIRVNRKTMMVQRLYVTQIERHKNGEVTIKKKEWREVDYKTTYEMKSGNRPCPKEYLRELLWTAF